MTQQVRHKEWMEKSGGIEPPTYLETLQKPTQIARIAWLYNHCGTAYSILDIGCSWGYVLDKVAHWDITKCGIDINPENIVKGKGNFPHIDFRVADVTKGLDFADNAFDIAIEADMLEHLHWWQDVETALRESLRVARNKVLITLPWRKDLNYGLCFKHKWVPTHGRVGWILTWLMQNAKYTSIECDDYFVYIEVIKRKVLSYYD